MLLTLFESQLKLGEIKPTLCGVCGLNRYLCVKCPVQWVMLSRSSINGNPSNFHYYCLKAVLDHLIRSPARWADHKLQARGLLARRAQVKGWGPSL